MRFFWLFAVVCFTPQTSHAQEWGSLTGEITDSLGRPLSHISVTLNDRAGRVLLFDVSDSKGYFSIRLPTDTAALNDGAYLSFSSLGYKQQQVWITLPERRHYRVVLEEQAIVLPDVDVHRPPIIHKSDTTIYDVRSFSEDIDRSIGDVLKRLPGVEMDERGQIYYNGRQISGLYIHGDDLMDGRYGLLPKIISKEMIQRVEVIQNHQPIRVLQNKVLSDRVAINLVLEDEDSWTHGGELSLAAGIPALYDAHLNSILLNNDVKMANTVKSNNVGVDYRDEFTHFNSSGFLNSIGNMRPDPILSTGPIRKPDIPQRYYYRNTSGVLNANNMINLSDTLQLRLNAQVFLDRNKLSYRDLEEFYLVDDTIRYYESQNYIQSPRLVNLSMAATVNRTSYYLMNNLRANFTDETARAAIDFNGNGFNQRVTNNIRDVSNHFSYTPVIRNKHLVNFDWYINYHDNGGALKLDTGLIDEVLNHGLPYRSINQTVTTPTLFNHASAGYQVSKRFVTQNYQVGFMDERQTLGSSLHLLQTDGTENEYDMGNDISWQRNRLYVRPTYEYKKGRLDASLSLPLIYQRINYGQPAYNLNEREAMFFVNPDMRVRYFINSEDYLQANHRRSNNFGNISSLYRGVIMTNYRVLNANDATLQQSTSRASSLYFNFQRSIIMLFAHAGINYEKLTANTILSSHVVDDVQRSILLPHDNQRNTLSINGSVSKYIPSLRTKATLRASGANIRTEQLVNDRSYRFQNNVFSITPSLEANLLSHISLSYRASQNWLSSTQLNTAGTSGGNINNSVGQFDQTISLSLSPVKGLFFAVRGTHFLNQQHKNSTNHFFSDASIRLRNDKWRSNIELELVNLANQKSITSHSLLSNQLFENTFSLRGRMAYIKGSINF